MSRNFRSSRSSNALHLTLAFFMLACAGGAIAQNRGQISGRVVDTVGGVLQGARVELQPSGLTIFSNGQGEFTLGNVIPNSYTVTVSYVGFAPTTSSVTVAPGQTARIDAQMKPASEGESITVTAERVHGEAEAINRTRASDNILQVLPFEVITSLPNTNIADALGRLPSVTLERDEGEGKYVQIRGTEPRLSNVTINGVNVPSPEGGVRQIKLDVIPSNLVESVEINKTLSANQDADAIGGSVNLVTKSASERPTFYLNGIGGYTPIINGRSLYEMDGTVGQRFGVNKKLGLLFGGSYDWNGRGIDDVEPGPTSVACDAGPTGCQTPSDGAPSFPTYGAEDLREYRYYRSRYGFAGSADYKLGDTSGLFVHFLYSHFNNFGDRWVYSPTTNSDDTTSGFLTPSLTDTNGSIAFNTSVRRPVEVIASLDAGGKHELGRWILAYDAAVSRSASEDHGYAGANFGNPNTYQFSIDTTNKYRPTFVPLQGYSAIYDPSQYSLTDGDVSHAYSPQLNLQAGFSAARNYDWGGHFGVFEFGAKFRNAHKFQDAIDDFYTADDPSGGNSLLMSNFLGNFTNSNYYDNSYKFGPTVDYGKIKSFIATSNLITPDVSATQLNSLANNYDLVERVTAGYLMNTINVGRFRIQTGVRFEATKEEVSGNGIQFDSNGHFASSSLVTKNNSYVDPLPSVQVRYGLPHDAAIRASYGRGISRPNFGDLPPYFNADASAGAVSTGNPNLKPTYANNYDLLYEKYLNPLGLIQAGVFYKQISKPIESIRTVITAPQQFGANYVGFELDEMTNGPDARLYGFEIAYQQHLTFLPGMLSGLGFSGNYGFTNSVTDGIPNRTDRPHLQRQAPNTWNLSPTYDRKRLSIRVGLSYNAANVWQYNYFDKNPDGSVSPVPLGTKGPKGDIYIYSHLQVDAQGSYRLYRGFEFVVAGLNLTNEPFGFYQGSPQYVLQREYYKPSYEFGLRWNHQGR